jgi:predicted amidophosphoribosyltransferase
VHQLKYRGWRGLAPLLAARMAAVELPGGREHARRICMPVPTSAARLRARGYNQAALLASAYAATTGLRAVDALRRAGGQRTQTTLQPLARRANVAGAFAPVPEAAALLSGAHVIVIDDVLTTGATAGECARTLADAGVCCITLVTFARALDARLIQT